MNKAFLLFLFGIVLCLPAHGQFAAVSRGPLSGNCNPHTLGIDYLANNVYSCDGSPAQWKLVGAAAVLTPSGTKAIPNCNAAGTVVNQTVQESSQTVNGVTTTCATVGAIGSVSVIGVCSVLGVCGTQGTAIVGTANTMPCIFDNSATVGDYVAPSASVTGFCTDVGSTKPTSVTETLGNVYQANGGGAGTIGYVEVAPLSLLLPGSNGGGGGGAGSINNCSQVGAIAYYSGLNIISCDLQFTTNGVGTFTAVGGIFTGSGAGFVAQVQGAAPSLSLSNAVYLFPPTSVSATYGLSWPGSIPTNGHCAEFSVSGSIAQFVDAGFACGSGGGSVTSLTATTPIVATPSTITSTGAFSCPTCNTTNATVSTLSVGNLSPLFTSSVATPTTTPAVTFTLSNAGANTYFGNNSNSSAAPSYLTVPACANDGAHALTYVNGTGFVCVVVPVASGQLGTPSTPTATVNGTPATTDYKYAVVGCQDVNCAYHTALSPVRDVSTGAATITSTNSITLSAYGDTFYGVRGFLICRTSSSGTPATTGILTGTLAAPTLGGKKFIDTGLAGDGTNCATSFAANTTVTQPVCLGSALPGSPTTPGFPCGVDGPPLTPTAFDDEATQSFGAPADINDPYWSWGGGGTSPIAQNSATASWSNGALILTSDTTAGNPLEGLVENFALPSPTFAFTAYVSALLPTKFGACGIGLRESSTGKLAGIFIIQQQAEDSTASPAGFGLEAYDGTSSTSVSSLHIAYFNSNQFYLRVKDDGTNITMWYSPSGDGVNFQQLATVAISTAFTTAPSQFYINTLAASPVASCTFDFVRRTQ